MPNLQESNAVWTEQKVIAIDGTEEAWFGLTVAISGNTAMVGAMNAAVDGKAGQGAVYVFKKVGYVWQQTHKLVANDGIAGDQFGGAITLLGTIAVITAPLAKINGKTWQGAAYVFSLSGTTWAQKQKLVASNGTAFATFGKSAALNAKSLFIGSGGVNQGGITLPQSVYVFRLLPQRNGDAWVERQILYAPNPLDTTSAFGTVIAVSDTTALIGARTSTINGVLGQGMVYGYAEINGVWTLTNKLVASDGAARHNFGTSIALSGVTALIGSPGVFKGTLAVGAVYRFDHKEGNWLQAQEFHAMDATAFNFGATVSMSNKKALIGAYAADGYRGTAYIFQEQAGIWTQVQQLKASDGAPGNVFGYTTAIDTSTALVGAFSADVGSHQDQGAVYFYNAPTWVQARVHRSRPLAGQASIEFNGLAPVAVNVRKRGPHLRPTRARSTTCHAGVTVFLRQRTTKAKKHFANLLHLGGGSYLGDPFTAADLRSVEDRFECEVSVSVSRV